MDIAALVTLISAVAWLAAIGLVVFFVLQASRGKPVSKGGINSAGCCLSSGCPVNRQCRTGIY